MTPLSRRHVSTLGAVAIAIAVLVVPARAAAVQRFAFPQGGTTGSCTASDPACDIEYAVETVATSGDEVIVVSGVYDLGGGTLDLPSSASGLDVHGIVGQSLPLLVSSGADAVAITSPTSTVRWLQIEHSGSSDALDLGPSGGVSEQVYAHSTAGNACHVSADGVILRDSVCWSTSETPLAQDGVLADAVSGTRILRLTNVTAIATGAGSSYGIELQAFNNSTDVRLDALNVIARGAGADVRAVASPGTSPPAIAAVSLHNSNFVTESEPGTFDSVSNPGAQIATPMFANPVSGDFHQLDCSITIDTGAVDASVGNRDLDGQPRVVGAAPDIGADESSSGCPGVPSPASGQGSDTTAPETKLAKQPKKRTVSRRARFEFESSEPSSRFECRLDDGGFQPCSSPFEVKVGKGMHEFAVRASDAVGNLDQTPAKHAWKVKAKRP